jgi:hypothetical protein
MRFYWGMVAAAAALLLVGCDQSGFGSFSSSQPSRMALPATPTKMPRYGDALAGLYGAPAGSVPKDVAINYYAPGGGSGKPGRTVLTMALVPGANYAKLHDYLGRAGNDLLSVAPSGAQDDLALEPVLTKATDIIKEHYPWMVLSGDLATAQRRNASLTLVLDIRGRLAAKNGDQTAVQIEVIAFNDQHKPVARFVSQGTAYPSASGYDFALAAKNALADLTGKANAYFN